MNFNKYYFILLFVLGSQVSLSQTGNQELPVKKYFTELRGNISLEIEITDLKSNKGYVDIGLNDSNENLLANLTSVKIKNYIANATFDSLYPGTFAIRFYHDENQNGKLDFNIIGIPKESYGSSNDVKPVLGPPKFEKMLFKLTENKKIIMTPVNK